MHVTNKICTCGHTQASSTVPIMYVTNTTDNSINNNTKNENSRAHYLRIKFSFLTFLGQGLAKGCSCFTRTPH